MLFNSTILTSLTLSSFLHHSPLISDSSNCLSKSLSIYSFRITHSISHLLYVQSQFKYLCVHQSKLDSFLKRPLTIRQNEDCYHVHNGQYESHLGTISCINLSYSIFRNSFSNDEEGGAFLVTSNTGSTISINQCQFTSCTAKSKGGALFINYTNSAPDHKLLIYSSIFSQCRVSNGSELAGGAIYCHTGAIEVINSTFSDDGIDNNTTPNTFFGGAIYAKVFSFEKLFYSKFEGCYAPKPSPTASPHPTPTPTAGFTESSVFTSSDSFTQSDIFSDSGSFSDSFVFTGSNVFSPSDSFTKTTEFTQTENFSLSSLFSLSTVFSQSDSLSDSFFFTSSNTFTHSEKFSESESFTATTQFTTSVDFTQSLSFSQSEHFSKSIGFSKSDSFSGSVSFSESSSFTESSSFQQSSYFSNSLSFSNSVDFSPSQYFSNSISFSNSVDFSPSQYFSNSISFSESSNFSESVLFSESVPFSESISFTPDASVTPTVSEGTTQGGGALLLNSIEEENIDFEALSSGGAVFVEFRDQSQPQVEIRGSNFTNCFADHGAALFFKTPVSLTINQSRFVTSSATSRSIIKLNSSNNNQLFIKSIGIDTLYNPSIRVISHNGNLNFKNSEDRQTWHVYFGDNSNPSNEIITPSDRIYLLFIRRNPINNMIQSSITSDSEALSILNPPNQPNPTVPVNPTNPLDPTASPDSMTSSDQGGIVPPDPDGMVSADTNSGLSTVAIVFIVLACLLFVVGVIVCLLLLLRHKCPCCGGYDILPTNRTGLTYF